MWGPVFSSQEEFIDGDRVAMLLALVQNLDVFMWSPYKVTGVDPKFIVHKLNMDPLFSPKK